MTNRKDTTSSLSNYLEKYLDPRNDPRIYWGKEITFDYATDHSIRVDYMKVNPLNNTISGIEKSDVYCYEVKSSIDDFNSIHGHNFIGDFNYYIMEESLYERVKDRIPYNVGVFSPKKLFEFDDKIGLVLIKKAKRCSREKSITEILLMMYRSTRREIVKDRKKKLNEEADNLEDSADVGK